MLNKQRIRLAVIGFAAVIFFGCPSQEYTSANVYIQQEEWAKAKEFLIKAIEVEPDNPEIPYKLGYYIYASKEKDWEKMNQSFDKALAIDPNKKIGQEKFYNKLIKLDPLVKKFLSASDSQRSMRAYEVKKFTKKSLFTFIKKTKSNFDSRIFKKLFINTPRELLHKKIDKRVEKMFTEGVVEEVRNFLNMKVDKELSSNKIIGIKEIKDHIDGKITLIKAKELIKLKTRQYAKRQFTWARGHMRSWEMIYSPNSNDLFKQAINKIS